MNGWILPITAFVAALVALSLALLAWWIRRHSQFWTIMSFGLAAVMALVTIFSVVAASISSTGRQSQAAADSVSRVPTVSVTPQAAPTTSEPIPTTSEPIPTESTVPASPPSGQVSQTYLADMDQVAGVPFHESVSLSGIYYPFSVVMFCTRPGLSLKYNVAGRSSFVGTLGIPDNADASGIILDVYFYNENRRLLHKIDVTLGRPAKVSFDLDSAVQLEIFCKGRFTDNNSVALGLGDAIIIG